MTPGPSYLSTRQSLVPVRNDFYRTRQQSGTQHFVSEQTAIMVTLLSTSNSLAIGALALHWRPLSEKGIYVDTGRLCIAYRLPVTIALSNAP